MHALRFVLQPQCNSSQCNFVCAAQSNNLVFSCVFPIRRCAGSLGKIKALSSFHRDYFFGRKLFLVSKLSRLTETLLLDKHSVLKQVTPHNSNKQWKPRSAWFVHTLSHKHNDTVVNIIADHCWFVMCTKQMFLLLFLLLVTIARETVWTGARTRCTTPRKGDCHSKTQLPW